MTFLHFETRWEKTLGFNICQDSSSLPLSKEKFAVLPLLLLQSIYYSVGKEEYPQEDLLHQFSEKRKVFLELSTSLYCLSRTNLDLIRCIMFRKPNFERGSSFMAPKDYLHPGR